MVTKTSHLPIRYLLALLWAQPILHISTIRVNNIIATASNKKFTQTEFKLSDNNISNKQSA